MFAYLFVVVFKAYDKTITDPDQPLLVSKLKKIVSVLCCIFLSMVIVPSRLQLRQCGAITVKFQNKARGLYFSKGLFEGLIFGGAFIHRGLSMEGNLRFKIDWASLIDGSKLTVLALF